MEKPLKVLIYGDTLVLGCLRASLEGQAELEVSGLDGLTASEQELSALQPDAVIFDLGAAQPAFQCALAEQLPGLLLVGIDPNSNRVQTWTGRQLRELSTQDLMRTIEHHASQWRKQ